jgi:hypothetical protein
LQAILLHSNVVTAERRGPIIEIMNESEIQRRDLLQEIGNLTNNPVISYLANPNASPNFIDHNDPMFINDLLECVGNVETLDIIIDSPGGDPNAAEKLAFMCRDHCENMRAIVINTAKSAATMWALACDKILMGYLSEIGPIDPQIRMISPQGQTTFVPAQSIIDSVVMLHRMLDQGIDQRVVVGLLQKLDPAIIDVAQKAINFSRVFAEEWLSQYMLRSQPEQAKSIAKTLSDNRRWLSHGKRIGFTEAQELGLTVEAIDRDSQLWKLLWEYYCRAQIMMNQRGMIKIYECKEMSINYTARIRRLSAPQQPPPRRPPQQPPPSNPPPQSPQ